jgi:hypothetical protein
VTVTPPFFKQVLQGIAAGRISGGAARDIAGVFSLGSIRLPTTAAGNSGRVAPRTRP